MKQLLWIEFSDVRLDIEIGIHDHEKGGPQPVLLDIRALVDPDATMARFLDYDHIEQFLIKTLPYERFDLQEDLARRVTAFLFEFDQVREVEVKLRKPSAYQSGLAPGIRLVTSKNRE